MQINKSIGVVVPVYNAQETLDELIGRLSAALTCFSEYRIILVNDCSSDNSWDIAKAHAQKDKMITAINLNHNVGQQLATFYGMQHLDYDYTAIIDDDLAQKPEDIIKLYNEAEKGYDVAYGVAERKPERNIVRNAGSAIRDVTFNIITKKPKNIKVCSFRIMNRQIAEKVKQADTEFIYISMEIMKYTRSIANVKVEYSPGLPSNYDIKRLAELIKNMYLYYSGQKIIKKNPLPKDKFQIGEIINGEIK